MPDVPISRTDVERLARKLDTLRGHFTGDEWTMLSAALDALVAGIGGPAAAASGRPARLMSFAAETDTDADTTTDTTTDITPGKIGNPPSMYDHVRSFGPADRAGVEQGDQAGNPDA